MVPTAGTSVEGYHAGAVVGRLSIDGRSLEAVRGTLLDLVDFTERMFSIERRLDLFSERVAGLPWWDAVRYQVFETLFSTLAGAQRPRQVRRPLIVRGIGWLRRFALRAAMHLRIALSSYDVLAFRAPRQLRGHQSLDPVIDDLLALCPARILTINTFPEYYHLVRRRTSRPVSGLDEALDRLSAVLRTEFGASFDAAALRRLIEEQLADFEGKLSGYRRLLARVRPRVVILTQNGMEKALFLAAHEAGIPVVEGQHGLIGPLHPAYSYADDLSYGGREMFPTTFLAFSDYWIRSCFYPAGQSVALGNDNFMVPPLPPPADPAAIMFVSSDIYHEVLAEWVIGLSQAVSERRIVYKLHPNQRDSAAAIKLQFAALPNVEVIAASPSTRALLSSVSHVVLIQSTVALEALQSGRRVCILPILQYRVHQDLFGLEAVSVTRTLDDLVSAVAVTTVVRNPPRFFDPFDVEAAERLIGSWLEE